MHTWLLAFHDGYKYGHTSTHQIDFVNVRPAFRYPPARLDLVSGNAWATCVLHASNGSSRLKGIPEGDCDVCTLSSEDQGFTQRERLLLYHLSTDLEHFVRQLPTLCKTFMYTLKVKADHVSQSWRSTAWLKVRLHP